MIDLRLTSVSVMKKVDFNWLWSCTQPLHGQYWPRCSKPNTTRIKNFGIDYRIRGLWLYNARQRSLDLSSSTYSKMGIIWNLSKEVIKNRLIVLFTYLIIYSSSINILESTAMTIDKFCLYDSFLRNREAYWNEILGKIAQSQEYP